MGDPLDPETQIGPLANPAQYNKVLGCIADAEKEGAILAFGGKPHAHPGGGLFVQPTVFDLHPGRQFSGTDHHVGFRFSSEPN